MVSPARGNFLWALASNLVSGACGLGAYVVLAKVGSPELVGQYGLGIAVVTPVGLLTDLHLRATLATDARGEFAFGDYLGLRLLMSGLGLVAVGLLAVLAGHAPEAREVILAVGMARVVESVIDLYYGLMQQHERMALVARSLLLRGPLSLVALGVGVQAGGVRAGVLAFAAARLLGLLAHDIPASARLAAQGVFPRWQGRALKSLAWLTLPLGVVMMLIAFNTYLPVYFVERYCTPLDLGIFCAFVPLADAGSLLAASAGQAVSPALARHYAARAFAAFRKTLLRLLAFGLGLGAISVLAALVVGRPFLLLLYRAEYAERNDVFVWLTAATALGYIASFLGWGLMATRRFFRYPVPYLMTTGVTLAASYLLVPRFGLVGAAWAVGAGNATSLVVLSGILALTCREAARDDGR